MSKSVIEIFWNEVFIVRNTVKQENLDVWPLFVANEAFLTMQFHLIVVLKTCVKDRGDSSSRLLERRI